jgi:hypothetical protein
MVTFHRGRRTFPAKALTGQPVVANSIQADTVRILAADSILVDIDHSPAVDSTREDIVRIELLLALLDSILADSIAEDIIEVDTADLRTVIVLAGIAAVVVDTANIVDAKMECELEGAEGDLQSVGGRAAVAAVVGFVFRAVGRVEIVAKVAVVVVVKAEVEPVVAELTVFAEG